jgi:hypothetical protein
MEITHDNKLPSRDLPTDQIVRVEICGVLDAELLSMTTSKMVEQIQQHVCKRILMDHRNAEVRLSRLELYDKPRIAHSLGVPHARKIAIVYSRTDEDHWLVELMGRSQGFNVSLFRDVDSAMSWLKHEPPPITQ